ncbi:MAG: hypothetical protein AAF436_03145 [Myxococcota bacterium]
MGSDRWFSISFWGCCALLLVPLWSVDYLPMVDLPQHAAQIGIWTRWSDPAFGYQELYTRNWFTPYLFGYLLAYALTAVLSINAALTTVISAAVVGVPVATRFLLREVGANRWWVFAVFPGVYGFSFDWGFFNFLVGIPIALASLVVVLRYTNEPTLRRGLGLAALLLGLFFVHVLLFGYVGLILGVTILTKNQDWKAGLLALVPAIAVCPVVILWLYVARSNEAMTHWETIWEVPWQSPRLLRLFAESAGDALSSWTLFAGVAGFALPLLLGGRPSRSPARWVPFGTTVGLFLLVPHEFLGTAYLYSRYAVFAIPTWLYAMDPKDAAQPARWKLALGPALAVACTMATFGQFRGYAQEVAGLGEVIEQIPENARVLSVPVRRNSRFVRTPVFLHTPAWYAAERGGVVDFSFAINFPLLFRYRDETEPSVPHTFVWNTGSLDWDAFDAQSYDYFVARDFGKQPSALLVRSGAPVQLLGRAGAWQLFGRR